MNGALNTALQLPLTIKLHLCIPRSTGAEHVAYLGNLFSAMNFLLCPEQSARRGTYLLSVEAVGLVHSLGELPHVERAQRIRQEGDDALEKEVEKENAAGAAEEAVEDDGQTSHLCLRSCAAVACQANKNANNH